MNNRPILRQPTDSARNVRHPSRLSSPPERAMNLNPRPSALTMKHARLSRHADYQRVYQAGRKQFSPSMTYFFAARPAGSPAGPGPRVGLTAGRVLGNAVERNRIKRRMREAVRRHLALLTADVDVVLHPRKAVMTMEFARLEGEVERIFSGIQRSLAGQKPTTDPAAISQALPQKEEPHPAAPTSLAPRAKAKP